MPAGFWTSRESGPPSMSEPVHLFAEDHAAGTRVTLEHDAPDALPRELVRRRESRDSAADDRDVRHVRQFS
jgi:hypothetical protein